TYEESRRVVEQAALDELAARDRDLLQELLNDFAEAYQEAKDRESALDFEDLQLRARDLLRDDEPIRSREQLRFRSIMVDEFPDPVFGPPVELLVTDKSSYAGDDRPHWRRAEAKAIARRVRELIDAGTASAGEIVLLFAAGTDAEWYEQELRAVGVRTHRGLGRGYFGQQQVGDLLAYLRLLHNRYDDEALVSVLASPLVGVSNDALVLLRRAAPKRPLFKGLERTVPEGLDPRDERLFQAFRQRFERLVAASRTLSLERLCEEIVAAHDYDLAVLAQWDGRRSEEHTSELQSPCDLVCRLL